MKDEKARWTFDSPTGAGETITGDMGVPNCFNTTQLRSIAPMTHHMIPE
jgi:hypothetical protein